MAGGFLVSRLRAALAAMACLVAGVCAASGLRGDPISLRIGPGEYRAAPSLWSIAAAPGKIYVASADGVLIHDGIEWTTLPLPVGVNATVVRHLQDGTLMVGGEDTYGRLEYDPLRGYRYVDLLASSGLPQPDRRLGPVWEFLQTPEGVYVQSQHFIHLIPAQGGVTRSWPMGHDMRGMMSFGGEIYMRFEGRGLGWLRGGELHLLPGGERFAHVPVSGIVGWGGNRFVVAGDGVWRLDDDGMVLALPWPDGELSVLTATPVDGGGFVVATLDGEALVVDAALRLRQRVTLSEQTVGDLTRDEDGSIWAITETEVVRVGIPSPWTLIGRNQGLRGVVADTAEFDGATWATTSRGVFRLEADGAGRVTARQMPWSKLESYGLFADERALLLGDREGLYQLLPGQTTPSTLIAGPSVYAPQPVRAHADLAIAYSDDAFYLLRMGVSGWVIAAQWPLEGASVMDVVQPTPGEFWLSDNRGPPQRWRIDLETGERTELKTYGGAQGLPSDGPERPRLFVLDGGMHAWTAGKTYRFDVAGDRFLTIDTPEWITRLRQPGKLTVVETTMGVFAVTPLDLMRRPASTMAWERVHIGGTATTGFMVPRVTRGGVLRVPVWNGFLQYAADGPVPPLPSLRVGFDQLLVQGTDGSFEAAVPDRDAIEMRSGRALRMRYTLGSLEPGARFRYRLSPIVDDFSEWTDRELTVRSLDPGDYLLEVEGDLPSGRDIAPLRLRIAVTPRWFERPTLRVLMALVGIGLVVQVSRVIGRRRVRRVEAQNRQLEQRIADRTADLERANARLAEIAVEDALTGVPNRRALEQALAREWARCGEQGLPLVALMIDVDHFKRFNDDHGHLEGDRVLVAVAGVLRKDLNMPLEILARYGGEEFTLLLPGADAELANRRAVALRDAVEHGIPGVTISVGVALAWPGPSDTPAALLRRADQALYEAKRLGRNRVVGLPT